MFYPILVFVCFLLLYGFLRRRLQKQKLDGVGKVLLAVPVGTELWANTAGWQVDRFCDGHEQATVCSVQCLYDTDGAVV
jgi:hypothetical protein